MTPAPLWEFPTLYRFLDLIASLRIWAKSFVISKLIKERASKPIPGELMQICIGGAVTTQRKIIRTVKELGMVAWIVMILTILDTGDT